MSDTTPNFFHLIILFLTLSLTTSLNSHQVIARNLLQLNYRDPSPQLGTPGLEAPTLNKPPAGLNFPAFQEPLLPPHFLPLLPFPSMPNIPSLPSTIGPSIPSFHTAPIPGIPSNVPPAFPIQPTKKISSENPSTTRMKSIPLRPSAQIISGGTPAFSIPAKTISSENPSTTTMKNIPLRPSAQIIPGPPTPPISGIPSNVLPAFPIQPEKTISSKNPSTTSMKKP